MRKFSTLLKAGAAAGALALTMAVAPGAGAAPSDRAVEMHQATTSESQRQQIRNYWTPARMEAAIPRGQGQNGHEVAKGKPGGGGGAAAAVKVAETPEFGKVFFTLGGTNYVCSGTATQSSNADVVTTAGHCLNEGPGAYATNFIFVPAYANGSAPYGEWVAENLVTTTQWRTAGDFNHDVGFAVMAEQGGQSLTQVTGSYPIAFNLGYNLAFEAYGYPAARPYDGQGLWKCSGTAGVDTRGTTDHRLPCSMTGGSSGGGWITGGALNSVNSFGYRGEKDVMYGPYFGSVEQGVYGTAATS
ncbi:trypsin-like serine peptidase [Ornithinimicrobium cavernae]|uniref:trypsin-like serine peptidase n=1 Tax=Ornithinimicrobium cavernae TaxID=2666047 RepID=UPI001F1F52C8|nr:hypothetical protein [Ornithinimicrobium cavernae]